MFAELAPFGVVIAVISVEGLLAVASHRINERIRVPAPAIFPVAAAITSDFVPVLGRYRWSRCSG
jgi:cell volume regulation protein A